MGVQSLLVILLSTSGTSFVDPGTFFLQCAIEDYYDALNLRIESEIDFEIALECEDPELAEIAFANAEATADFLSLRTEPLLELIPKVTGIEDWQLRIDTVSERWRVVPAGMYNDEKPTMVGGGFNPVGLAIHSVMYMALALLGIFLFQCFHDRLQPRMKN